jgi:DNA-binding PadR family transcriptional regulator
MRTAMRYPLSGDFEQLVLLAILRLEVDAYAVPIRREIERCGDRPVSRGALYTTLERLEAKGLLRSALGDSLPERGGRARRCYTVTAAGLEALRNARRTLERLWQGLEALAEEGP